MAKKTNNSKTNVMTTDVAINGGKFPLLKTFPYVDVAKVLIAPTSEAEKVNALTKLGVSVWDANLPTAWTEQPDYEPDPTTVTYELSSEVLWEQYMLLCVQKGVPTATTMLILGPFLTSASGYDWGRERNLDHPQMMEVMTSDSNTLESAVQKLCVGRTFLEESDLIAETDEFRIKGQQAAIDSAAEWIVENKLTAL